MFSNKTRSGSKFSASILFDEVVQDEEEAESSTQSIQIEESLLGVTPSPSALEVYEISDISSSHIFDLEEDIRRRFLLKKNSPSILCKNSPVILLFYIMCIVYW